ncbi:MAG: MliC family protein [Arenimonas sp.]|nr:MliC family protein [Arenimonas sp.]
MKTILQAFSVLAVAIVLPACKQPSPELSSQDNSANIAMIAPAAVPPPAEPVKPSFDCAKTEHEAETLVCTDYGLAALDNRLAELYAAELAKPGASKDLAATQRGWVKGRDECWKADDKKLCVEESYRTRIAELQINSPGAMAATAVEFKCNDNSKPFTMAYYNELDDKPAIITLGNDQAIIFPQLAASGAKYGRKGIEYWEHQGKATVDFFGIALECTPVPANSNL